MDIAEIRRQIEVVEGAPATRVYMRRPTWEHLDDGAKQQLDGLELHFTNRLPYGEIYLLPDKACDDDAQ